MYSSSLRFWATSSGAASATARRNRRRPRPRRRSQPSHALSSAYRSPQRGRRLPRKRRRRPERGAVDGLYAQPVAKTIDWRHEQGIFLLIERRVEPGNGPAGAQLFAEPLVGERRQLETIAIQAQVQHRVHREEERRRDPRRARA